MLRVLVVEDSALIRELLVQILTAAADISVVGTATNGEEAVAAVARLRPDLVTMDIHMPKLNGFAATRNIMQTTPTPIVIVSGSADSDVAATAFLALDAGALAVAARPLGLDHPDHERSVKELLTTIRLMAEVKVVRRWSRGEAVPAPLPMPGLASAAQRPSLIAIGASTGGPTVLKTILSALTAADTPPILVVQHIAQGFLSSFIAWLAAACTLPVLLAVDGERLQPGHIYFAPEDRHLGVREGAYIQLSDAAPEFGMRPAVACLFRSLVDSSAATTVAILLTGMGVDGAAELKRLRVGGALTIAQDKNTAAVYGMPGEAIRLEAASQIMAPEEIAAFLRQLSTASTGAHQPHAGH